MSGNERHSKLHPPKSHIGRSKQVEYVELIYDLIFVFLLQQDNSLLAVNAHGFFSANEFWTYAYSTLIVLQVWLFSVIYINRYGESTFLDHIFLFANMYLLYYMGVETRLDWWTDYQVYNTAWALILINLAVQCLIRAHRVNHRHPKAKHLTRVRALLYFLDAGLVLLTIPIFRTTGVSLVWLALLIGYIGPFAANTIEEAVPISAEHLSERVMLFVVFTFGEMIVSISDYFKDDFSWQTIYFSLTGFILIIGLFMSYGYLYNHIMDRHQGTNGKVYLLIHVIIVFALSNVSVSLEHMRSLHIDEFQNSIFISVSLVAYYLGLFLIARRTERVRENAAPFIIPALTNTGIFLAVILFASQDPWVVIGACAAYAVIMYAMIVFRWRAVQRRNAELLENKAESA